MQNDAENDAKQHDAPSPAAGCFAAAIGGAALGGGGSGGTAVDPKGHGGAAVQSVQARPIRAGRRARPDAAGWRAGAGIFQRRPRRAALDPEFLGELVPQLPRGACAAHRSRRARAGADLWRRRQGRAQARPRLSPRARGIPTGPWAPTTAPSFSARLACAAFRRRSSSRRGL